MSNVKVLKDQCLLDIAIQETGTLESVFEIAAANGMGITDPLTPGSEVIIQVGVLADVKIRNYFRSAEINPASEYVENSAILGDGIEFWRIEYEFTVG